MLEAKAKEEHIELLRRQSVRRLLSRDLADGWSAWAEMWSAKRWSKDKLRECANRLHAPDLSNAWRAWMFEVHARPNVNPSPNVHVHPDPTCRTFHVEPSMNLPGPSSSPHRRAARARAPVQVA